MQCGDAEDQVLPGPGRDVQLDHGGSRRDPPGHLLPGLRHRPDFSAAGTGVHPRPAAVRLQRDRH